MKTFIQILLVVFFSSIFVGCDSEAMDAPPYRESAIHINNSSSEDIYVFVIGDDFSKEGSVSVGAKFIVKVGKIESGHKSFEVSAVRDGVVVGSTTVKLYKDSIIAANFFDDGFN